MKPHPQPLSKGEGSKCKSKSLALRYGQAACPDLQGRETGTHPLFYGGKKGTHPFVPSREGMG